MTGAGSGTVLALFRHCSGTVPALLLTLSLPLPSLAWPLVTPIYALVDTGLVRASWTHPGTPPTPGTPPATHAGPAGPAVRARRQDRLWGSLLAAPMATCTGFMACPVKPGLCYPLIGTPVHAPCVTANRAITADGCQLTLLWSTLLTNAIMAIKTPARACDVGLTAIMTVIMGNNDPLAPYPIFISY